MDLDYQVYITYDGSNFTKIHEGSFKPGSASFLHTYPVIFDINTSSGNRYYYISIFDRAMTHAFNVTFSYSRISTLLNKDGLETIKGKIANLVIEENEIYGHGDKELFDRSYRIYTKRTTLPWKKRIFSFSPANLYIQNSTFVMTVKYVVTNVEVTNTRTGYLRLYHKTGSTTWTLVDSCYIQAYDYDTHSWTFNNIFSNTDTSQWRIDVYFEAGNGTFSIDFLGIVPNIHAMSLSTDGIYGNSYGTFTGTASLDDAYIGGFSIGDDGISFETFSDNAYTMDFTTLYFENEFGDNVTLEPLLLEATLDGTTKHVSWTSSDERQKEEIEPIDEELSMAFITGSKPKKFKFKNEEGKHYGVTAQDARKLLDELGETDSVLEHGLKSYNPMYEDLRTVEYPEYVAHLINCIKYLEKKTEKQQSEIDELKEIIKNTTV